MEDELGVIKNMKLNGRNRLYVLTGLLFVLASFTFVYVSYGARIEAYIQLMVVRFSSPIPDASSVQLARGLATYKDLWMNGYLGVFFNFKWLGYLNWLAIPLLIYFLFSIRKRKRWEIALAFLYVFSCLLIGVKGWHNERYGLTLVPFTIAIVLVEGWSICKDTKARCVFILFCALLIFLGFHNHSELYRNYLVGKLWNGRWDSLPMKIIDYLNNDHSMGEGRVLVFQQPFLFYYTNRKAIEYGSPGMGTVYSSSNRLKAMEILEKGLGVKYILLSTAEASSMSHVDIIGDIIYRDSRLILEDKGIELYRINRTTDIPLRQEEIEGFYKGNSTIRNGSFERWPAGPDACPESWQGASRITREDQERRVGRYSAKITGDNFNLIQQIPDFERFKGRRFTCFAWIKTAVPGKYRIQIYDGVDASVSKIHNGDGSWQLFQATHTVNSRAQFLEVRAIQAARTGHPEDTVYVDGVLLVEGEYFSLREFYKRNQEDKQQQ